MRRFVLPLALVVGIAGSQGAIAAPVLGGMDALGHPPVTQVYYHHGHYYPYYYRGHYYPYRYNGHYYRNRYYRHGRYYYY